MNKDKCKKLKKLQKIYLKAVEKLNNFDAEEKLTVSDLHLLLTEDEHTRRLIQNICKEEDAPDTVEASKAHEETDDSAVTTVATPVPDLSDEPVQWTPPPLPKEVLREQLAAELALLNAVKADAELAAKWLRLDADENEARQLVRLLAVIGHWDEVQDLWSLLAERCKHHQRAATPTECDILNAALSLHNLRYRDRAAQTVGVEIGIPFDPKQMERATAKGSTVTAVWWSGLKNAGGKLQNVTLVATE